MKLCLIKNIPGRGENPDKYITLFRRCLKDFSSPDPLGCGSDEVLDNNENIIDSEQTMLRCWLVELGMWLVTCGSGLKEWRACPRRRCGQCVM